MPTILPANRIKYTLHSPSDGDREVTPTGESSFKITFELHDDAGDPLFDYIVKVSGTLTFAGEDYAWIKAIEDDVMVRGEGLLIEFTDLATGETLVDGAKLVLNDGQFDLDRCTVEIPVTTPDSYEVFNGAKDDDLNMFDLGVSGSYFDIHPLGYVPTFELNYSPYDGPAGGFDIDHQDFKYFPNSKGEYPGFSVEGQTAGDYVDSFPSSASKLFDTMDMQELTTNPSGQAELNVGTQPYHNGYANPLDAVNDGWRLYSFVYQPYFAQVAGKFNYASRFIWLREIKDVPTGTAMTPEWVLVSSGGGTDRYARAPILLPRTNMNRPAFKSEAYPGVTLVFIYQTTFCVGLNYANIIITSGTWPELPDGTTPAPTGEIMSINPYYDWVNYYGLETISNGKPLNDLIEWVVNHCDPSLTVKSDFLQINPTVISSNNYVTGQPSYVDDIIILQKSDVKRPFATNKATRGMFTPSKLFTALMEMFNLRYRINGSDFILEHISSSYFVKPATLNLTAPPLNERLAGLRRYSYDKKDKLPAKETFKFMEGRPQGAGIDLDDFNGLPILYYGSNVDRSKDSGVLEHAVDNITTDVFYIMINGGGLGYLIDAVSKNAFPVQNSVDDNTIADDGFVLIASKVVVTGGISSRYMFVEEPILGDNKEMNNVLGWAFLHRDFFMTNRNTKNGELNGTPIIFPSTKYIKLSTDLNFDMCNINDFDPFELIDSALGEGIVKNAEFSISDKTITVVLGYQE